MSKLGDMFVLGQQVSIAAKEEVSRYDLPQVDVDHLLLALLVSGGPAGEVLRSQGLSLDATREATEQVRARQVARLGIVPPAAEPRPIRDPSLGEIYWTRRALNVVKGNDAYSELGLLTGLLDEPSGLVVEVLAEAGVDLVALRAAVTEQGVPARPTRPTAAVDPDWRATTHTGFAPSPVAEVWALVSDPTRRPEWDSAIGEVEPIEPGTWQMTSAANHPDGSRVRIHPDYRRTQHRLTAYVPEDLVEWEITLPDLQKSWSGLQRLSIRIRPATGGTALELTLSWPRRHGWRRVQQTLLGPAHRAVAKQSLIHYALGVSRRLR